MILPPMLLYTSQLPAPCVALQTLRGPAPVACLPAAPEFSAPPAAAEEPDTQAQDSAPAPADQTPITVTGHEPAPPGDPLMHVNEASFHAVQKADDLLVAPAAKAYKGILPGFVRDGLHNFSQNLHEPTVFVNFLLQGKPGHAAETIARFAINSTIGAAGLVDIAKRKPFDLPYRNNGFADTMGFYGIKPGPFFYLPLLGPTTVRDLAGLALDKALLPVAVGSPFTKPAFSVTQGTINSLDDRVRFDARVRQIRESEHPYATARSIYLTERQAEIDGLHSKRKPAREAN